MSIRANKPATDADATNMLSQAASDLELAEGNNYCVASPDKPLKRQLVVSIRASLNDLCPQKQKGTWAPSADALKSIFQQKKFVSLDGSADAQGDLKSVVLHDLSVHAVSSTFPVSLGAKITGVDDQTFSSNGEAYSMIVLPKSNSANERSLQADDVSLGKLPSQPTHSHRALTLSLRAQPTTSRRNFRRLCVSKTFSMFAFPVLCLVPWAKALVVQRDSELVAHLVGHAHRIVVPLCFLLRIAQPFRLPLGFSLSLPRGPLPRLCLFALGPS